MATATFNLAKYNKDKSYKDNWLNTVKGMNVRRLFIMPDPKHYGLDDKCALKMRTEMVHEDGLPFTIISRCVNAFVKIHCGVDDE